MATKSKRKAAKKTARKTTKKGSKKPAAKKKATAPKVGPGGPCPASERHTNTRIYGNFGGAPKCACDDCGNTWLGDPELLKESAAN